MFKNHLRRALVAATALAFAAGCSGNSMSIAPGQSSLAPSARHVPPGMRLIPGPVVAGPILVPLLPRQVHAPHGWPAKKKKKREILFVADASSGVLMYDPKTPNGSPTGSITAGVNAPAGVAVDKKGALYVTNDGGNTVTVYPKGQSSPSMTISDGIDSPYGIAVDSSGEVFVSNLGNETVVAYKAGATSPFETIDFSRLGQPVGVGVDGKNNIWVACDSSNSVFEIPAGTSTPKNAGLADLNGPIGIAFGKGDVIYVSIFSATPSVVEIYPYGSTSPSSSITSGIEQNGPTLNGFTASGMFFQSNQAENVVGYKKGQTSPFSTLSGAASPLGIASSPEIKK
jgi:hypothetical protein